MSEPLSREALSAALSVRDLTDPAEGPHALQDLVVLASDAVVARWDLELLVHRGERIVDVADNYDALRFTPDAASRDARYARYVGSDRMLRSHTSALIPGALRGIAERVRSGWYAERGLVVACPGVVHRRDSIDRHHTGTPHQLDIWVVRPQPTPVRDLDELCGVLARALVPGLPWRTQPRAHPYTHRGRQVDVLAGAEWVEVWECGLAHPDVLRSCGLAGWSGLALGMGLDRLLMLRCGIPDIRLLRSPDPRVAGQLVELGRYEPVSDHPPIVRDLSVALDPGDAVEDLGDRVRAALGSDADAVEAVEVLAETPVAELPQAAAARLGARPDQRNALVRVVLRALDRTLTAVEANALRDRIYVAVHRGDRLQLAGDPRPTPGRQDRGRPGLPA